MKRWIMGVEHKPWETRCSSSGSHPLVHAVADLFTRPTGCDVSYHENNIRIEVRCMSSIRRVYLKNRVNTRAKVFIAHTFSPDARRSGVSQRETQLQQQCYQPRGTMRMRNSVSTKPIDTALLFYNVVSNCIDGNLVENRVLVEASGLTYSDVGGELCNQG
jgi:hypothetical protein